jgi:hypothetical protein
VCTLDGELVWISDPIEGARHDVFCLDASGALQMLDPRDWTGDKGYVGAALAGPDCSSPTARADLADLGMSLRSAPPLAARLIEVVPVSSLQLAASGAQE